MHISRSIDIGADAGTVWTVLTDVTRWPEWTSSMSAVELLDGDLAIGRRVRIAQPRLPVTVWTVADLEPGRFFSWTSSRPGSRTVAGHRLTPTADGVTVDLTLDMTGPAAGLAGLLFGRMSRRYVDLEAEGLRRRCETGAD